MTLNEKKTNYINKVEQLKNYYEKYSIDSLEIIELLKSIENFYVVTPLIGGFSSGKSSLINAIINMNVLPVEITPETSIPTEIMYSPVDKCQRLTKGEWVNTNTDEIRANKYSYLDTKLIRAFINLPFLKEIQSIKLVDIPGLDSGIEAHNKAIDDYLLNSLAYIITIDSEQGLTESVILFLKELKLLGVPILVVLTKTDKRTHADTKDMLDDVKMKIEKYLGIGKFEIVATSAREKEIRSIISFLLDIQKKSDEIFDKSISHKVNAGIQVIEKYIKTRLNQDNYSIEEIDEKEKILLKQIDELKDKIEKENQTLNSDIDKCINLAEGKLRIKLENSTDSLVADLVANRNPKTQINSLVRTSILESIQTEITPRIQKFFNNVADLTGIELMIDSNLDIDPVKGKMNDLMKESIKKTIPLILASVGFVVAGPIVALIVGVLSVLTDIFFEKKKQEEAKRAAEIKVRNEIIPQVTEQVISSFRSSILTHLAEISDKLHESIAKDKELKEKALEDLKMQKNKAIEEQESIINELNSDLSLILELKD